MKKNKKYWKEIAQHVIIENDFLNELYNDLDDSYMKLIDQCAESTSQD